MNGRGVTPAATAPTTMGGVSRSSSSYTVLLEVALLRGTSSVHGSADNCTRRPQTVLDGADGELAEVEDAGGQDGVRARCDGRREVLRGPRAAARDHGDGHGRAHQPDQLQVETVPRAVRVHRVQQDLPGTEFGRPAHPVD